MSDPRTPPTSGAQLLRGGTIDETAKAFYEKEINFFNEIERLVKHFYHYDARAGKYTTLKPGQDFVTEGMQITPLQQRALDVLLEPYRDLINEREAILKRDDAIPETDYLARIEAIATNERYNELMIACMESVERFREFNLKDILKSIPINPEQPQRVQTVNSIASRPAAHLIELKDFGKSIHKMAAKSNESKKSGIAAVIHNSAQDSLISYEQSHIDYKVKMRELMNDIDVLVKKKAGDDDIAAFTSLNNKIKQIDRSNNMNDKGKFEAMMKAVNDVIRWRPDITLTSLKPPEMLVEIPYVPNNAELIHLLQQLMSTEPKFISDLDVTDSLMDAIRNDINLLQSDFIDDKSSLINRLYENLAQFEKRIQVDMQGFSRSSLSDEMIQKKQTQLIMLEQIIPNKNILISAQSASVSAAAPSSSPDPKGKGHADQSTRHESHATQTNTFTSNVSSTSHLLQRVGIRDTKDRGARSHKKNDAHTKDKRHHRDHAKKEDHTKSNTERVSFTRPSTTSKKNAMKQPDPSTLFSEAQSTDKLKRPPTSAKKTTKTQTDPRSVFPESKPTDSLTRPRRGGR